MSQQVSNPILLVDCHDDSREAVAGSLESEGYAVVTATNGRDALAMLFAGLRPQVIVMDMMMPVMNGFEFRQEQLRYPDLADIPFIARSAVIDVAKRAQHLNAAAYLQKPGDRKELLRLMRQFYNS
jgi:CheY-like chemotaxis protein